MLDLMELTEPQQVKAIMHPLRQQIVKQLSGGPATPSEVGRALGAPANKVHYHVRILEKAGIVRLVETRQVGSVTETYFANAARRFEIRLRDKDGKSRLEQTMPLLDAEIRAILTDLNRLAAIGPEATKKYGVLVHINRLEANPEDEDAVEEAITRLRERFAEACKQNPGRNYRLAVALVPMDVKGEREGDDA